MSIQEDLGQCHAQYLAPQWGKCDRPASFVTGRPAKMITASSGDIFSRAGEEHLPAARTDSTHNNGDNSRVNYLNLPYHKEAGSYNHTPYGTASAYLTYRPTPQGPDPLKPEPFGDSLRSTVRGGR
jgi:hypothetical protein